MCVPIVIKMIDIKKILLIVTSFWGAQSLTAQSQLINEMTNAVTELTGSFLDNPSHHSNTIKVYSLTQDFKKATDEVYTEALYSSHPQASSDLPYLDNVKNILKCLDFITANIVGYSRGGCDAIEWDATFNPILSRFGWTWKVIHFTEDIVFYEYSKDDFKMILAKNILQKKESGDYNAVAFSCESWDAKWKRYTSGVRRIVYGGDYQFVGYGDDEKEFERISKVASIRGNSFDGLE